jgi:hypothetical protein
MFSQFQTSSGTEYLYLCQFSISIRTASDSDIPSFFAIAFSRFWCSAYRLIATTIRFIFATFFGRPLCAFFFIH